MSKLCGNNIEEMIYKLRGEPSSGWSVTILCENDDPPPVAAVTCQGDWTRWEDKRFEGDSLHEALMNACTELDRIRSQ